MFLHKEVIDVFHENFYNTTIQKLAFHISHVRIIGSTEWGNTGNYCFQDNALKTI